MPLQEPGGARPRRLPRVVGSAAALAVALALAWSLLPGGTQHALAATTTFVAVADANLKSTSPTKNYGTLSTLQVRAPSPEYRIFLRFTVAGLTGPATAAKLRLFVTDASPNGGQVFAVAGSWTEDRDHLDPGAAARCLVGQRWECGFERLGRGDPAGRVLPGQRDL